MLGKYACCLSISSFFKSEGAWNSEKKSSQCVCTINGHSSNSNGQNKKRNASEEARSKTKGLPGKKLSVKWEM